MKIHSNGVKQCTQLQYKHEVSLYLSLIMHMQIWKSALQEISRDIFSAWYDFNSSLVSLGIWIICESFQNCLRPSSPVIDQWTVVKYLFLCFLFYYFFFLTQTPFLFNFRVASVWSWQWWKWNPSTSTTTSHRGFAERRL